MQIMSSSIQIRPMTENDIDMIYKGLSGHDISKPRDYVKRCWEENQRFERDTLLAFYHVEFVGLDSGYMLTMELHKECTSSVVTSQMVEA